MGKNRKNRVHENQGESKRMSERLADWMDEKNDSNTAKVRLQAQELWMEMCNVDRPEEINYDDPRIHLEWFLCDQRVLAKLTNGQREEVLEMMDDQQR